MAQAATSNDTFANQQWYLDAIHARQGWDSTTGSRDVVVAVIDSGVDIDHPDLKNTIWKNPNEIPGNNKDDDGDGYIDDTHGWNFVTDSADVHPVRVANAIQDAWLHGTAVASLIAAEGNNDLGISGVAWHASIMPLVVLGPDGYGRDDSIIRAVQYAVAHGADIINLSLVGYDYDTQLSDAIHEATAQGVLVVSAAGNSDTNVKGEDLDLLPGYPACDKGAAGLGALSVTGLSRDNTKAPLANYGTCVDISAPGQDLFAARPITNPGSTTQHVAGYTGGLDGTSVAAPLVSGLAALLKAEHPNWKGPEIAQRILSTADSVDSLNPNFAGKMGKGRINVARALVNDAATNALGPLTLNVSAPGQAPEIRVLGADGKELSHFPVSGRGDRRGVAAAFIRWQGNTQPDIAISMIGDTSGAWRVYRPDGLLIAAGKVGNNDIKGGLNIASQDLNAEGLDVLFLGERGGSRAWLVDSSDHGVYQLRQFASGVHKNIVALSVTLPTPAFFVTSEYGSRDIRVIGSAGDSIVEAKATTVPKDGAWLSRRGARIGGGDVYEFTTTSSTLLFVTDANGLHATKDAIVIDHWAQIPDGQPAEKGWRYVETWSR